MWHPFLNHFVPGPPSFPNIVFPQNAMVQGNAQLLNAAQLQNVTQLRNAAQLQNAAPLPNLNNIQPKSAKKKTWSRTQNPRNLHVINTSISSIVPQQNIIIQTSHNLSKKEIPERNARDSILHIDTGFIGKGKATEMERNVVAQGADVKVVIKTSVTNKDSSTKSKKYPNKGKNKRVALERFSENSKEFSMSRDTRYEIDYDKERKRFSRDYDLYLRHHRESMSSNYSRERSSRQRESPSRRYSSKRSAELYLEKYDYRSSHRYSDRYSYRDRRFERRKSLDKSRSSTSKNGSKGKKNRKEEQNLDEVSDTPLEDGDFEEVEVASVEEVPTVIGFRKCRRLYLGFGCNFFKAKIFNISKERTIVSSFGARKTETDLNQSTIQRDVDNSLQIELDKTSQDIDVSTIEQSKNKLKDSISSTKKDLVSIIPETLVVKEEENEAVISSTSITQSAITSDSDKQKNIDSSSFDTFSKNENIIQGISMVEDSIADCNMPLIGIEYIVEVRYDLNESKVNKYYCVLCEADIALDMDASYIINHINSYVHSRKYLENHFPSCGFKFSESTDNYFNILLLQKCYNDVWKGTAKSSMCITTCRYFKDNFKDVKKFTDCLLHLDESSSIINFTVVRQNLEEEILESISELLNTLLESVVKKTDVAKNKKECDNNIVKSVNDGASKVLQSAQESICTKLNIPVVLGGVANTDHFKPSNITKNVQRSRSYRRNRRKKPNIDALHNFEVFFEQQNAESSVVENNEIINCEETNASIDPYNLRDKNVAETFQENDDNDNFVDNEEIVVLDTEECVQVPIENNAIKFGGEIKTSPKDKNKHKGHQKTTQHSKHCIKRIISKFAANSKLESSSLHDTSSNSSRDRHLAPSPHKSRKQSRSPNRTSRRYSPLSNIRRNRSPIRILSRSSNRRRSRSPLRRRSRSPLKRRSRSPLKRRSRSPLRRRSRSSDRRNYRKFSRSPAMRYSRSHSRSPIRFSRKCSRSPIRSSKRLDAHHTINPGHSFQRFSKSPDKNTFFSVKDSFCDSYKSMYSADNPNSVHRKDIHGAPTSVDNTLYRNFEENPKKDPKSEFSAKSLERNEDQPLYTSTNDKSKGDKNRAHMIEEIMKLPEPARSMIVQMIQNFSLADKNSNEALLHKIIQFMNSQNTKLSQPSVSQIQLHPHGSNIPNVQGLPMNLNMRPSSQLGPGLIQGAMQMQRGVNYPLHSVQRQQISIRPGANPFSAPFGNISPQVLAMTQQQNLLQANMKQVVHGNSFQQPAKPAVPPELLLQNLKAKVSKLFGANSNEANINTSLQSNSFIQPRPQQPYQGKWAPDQIKTEKFPFQTPHNAQSKIDHDFRSIPGLSSSEGMENTGRYFNMERAKEPQAKPAALSAPHSESKMVFCEAPRNLQNMNLFPVVSNATSGHTQEPIFTQNMSDVKISLAQRLASVLVKVGMVDVPAPLLQEMLMKIGAFSSCPPQDIKEAEILGILKRLGYL